MIWLNGFRPMQPSSQNQPTCVSAVLIAGLSWYTVTSVGRAAHGSRYDEGVDAIMRMGRFPRTRQAGTGTAAKATTPARGYTVAARGDDCGRHRNQRLCSPMQLQVRATYQSRRNRRAGNSRTRNIVPACQCDRYDQSTGSHRRFHDRLFEIAANRPVVQVVEQAMSKRLGQVEPHVGATFGQTRRFWPLRVSIQCCWGPSAQDCIRPKSGSISNLFAIWPPFSPKQLAPSVPEWFRPNVNGLSWLKPCYNFTMVPEIVPSADSSRRHSSVTRYIVSSPRNSTDTSTAHTGVGNCPSRWQTAIHNRRASSPSLTGARQVTARCGARATHVERGGRFDLAVTPIIGGRCRHNAAGSSTGCR